ncbi:MAG: hypothetical protein U0936_28525 [Planctomycetaceae bacterium]
MVKFTDLMTGESQSLLHQRVGSKAIAQFRGFSTLAHFASQSLLHQGDTLSCKFQIWDTKDAWAGRPFSSSTVVGCKAAWNAPNGLPEAPAVQSLLRQGLAARMLG